MKKFAAAPLPFLPALVVLLLAGCYEQGTPTTASSRPTQAVEAFQAAEAELRAGNSEDALVRAEAAVKADPTFEQAAWLQASLLGQAGRLEEALVVCETLTAQSPDFVQAHLLQGILWDKLGDSEAANVGYDAALRCFAALPEAERRRPETVLQEALITFLRHGRLAGIQAINRVLLQYPDYQTALYIKACMHDKDRGFLLRWFSESGGENAPAPDQPGKPRNTTDGAETPPGD